MFWPWYGTADALAETGVLFMSYISQMQHILMYSAIIMFVLHSTRTHCDKAQVGRVGVGTESDRHVHFDFENGGLYDLLLMDARTAISVSCSSKVRNGWVHCLFGIYQLSGIWFVSFRSAFWVF